jgi:uncharacterized SAM-binding protein YcdF (DUF218 family)
LTREVLTKTRRVFWLALAVLVILCGLFYRVILAGFGNYLVRSTPPEKADIAFVLAGDSNGNRILKAAELVRQGYTPKVLVSGPQGIYGFHECDLAIPFAEKAGYPESYFLHFEHQAHSTGEEADAAVPELRRLGAKHVLLVTSDYHTRRAGRIFRAKAPDISFTVVSAPDFYFTPDNWWHNREARKTFVIEWMKTVAEWFGL